MALVPLERASAYIASRYIWFDGRYIDPWAPAGANGYPAPNSNQNPQQPESLSNQQGFGQGRPGSSSSGYDFGQYRRHKQNMWAQHVMRASPLPQPMQQGQSAGQRSNGGMSTQQTGWQRRSGGQPYQRQSYCQQYCPDPNVSERPPPPTRRCFPDQNGCTVILKDAMPYKTCPMGYSWIRLGSSHRCWGGDHLAIDGVTETDSGPDSSFRYGGWQQRLEMFDERGMYKLGALHYWKSIGN